MTELILEEYQRDPLRVLAVQITEDNFEQVAKKFNGTIVTKENGERVILLEIYKPRKPWHDQARVDNWVLQSNRGLKVYSDAAFRKAFVRSKGSGGSVAPKSRGSAKDAMAKMMGNSAGS